MDRKYLAFWAVSGGKSKSSSLLQFALAILDKDLNILHEESFNIAPPEGKSYTIDVDVLKTLNIDLSNHDAQATPFSMVSERLFRVLYNHTQYGRIAITPVSYDIRQQTDAVVPRLIKQTNWEHYTDGVGIDLYSIAINEQRKGNLPQDLTIDLPSLLNHFNIETDTASALNLVHVIIEVLKKF